MSSSSLSAGRRSAWLSILVLLLASPLVRAAADPLSLTEAVRLAGAEAPSIAAHRAAVSAAESAVEPAGQLPDPELSLGIEDLPVTTDEAFSLTRDDFTMRTVGLMQKFPRREKRALRTARAQAEADRERALLINERLSTAESVARAWIARASAEERLKLLESLRPRAQAQSTAANTAISAGRSTAADGIAAKLAQSSLEDRISQARRDVEEARAMFERWLPQTAERPLADAPDYAELGVDPDTLISNIAHHRELLTYDAAERAASADVDLARADKRPDWSVELSYGQRGPRYSNFVSLEFRVDLPIFATHRQDPMIASKLAAAEQVAAEREAARRMHTAELRKTVATWRSAKERAQRYRSELMPLSEDRAEAALAAYRGGRLELQASLAALTDAIEQRIAYTEVLDTLGQSWAALHFAFAEER